ncbi:hypothetical protein D7Y13_27465 [Corallococcus praedator]|uniref:Carboxypeptidase regulatory-like domain-containing protein n=1 Tax=Corallococcus praedator TaxID=2316724 RepID=A0ABX9QB98_9BACT|nr:MULTISPECIES: hypothetical protein [Corallococcus]RKH12606.1 hypothetical protein D7X74_23385 [Corallococcus sp. CA047B]RKH24359.1 hypothetical protein D7X75_32065 [Corallococcus sp. CA031C]RKH99776.1 hypothetical protein D7Y13_27465 [Corallococcus praedator]
MRRATFALLGWAVLAWACSGSSPSLPKPTILSVEPATLLVSSKDEELTIRFDAQYAVSVDYGEEKVNARTTATGHVWVDEMEAVVTQFDPQGVAVVTMPRGLGSGAHTVKLRLDDGREAVAEGALTLTPPGKDKETDPEEEWDAGVLIAFDAGVSEAEVDAGSMDDAGTPGDAGPHPDDPILPGDITGFTFDPIEGARTSRLSFTISVRAEGPRAAHFKGSLELTSSRGKVTPTKIGPCDSGVCTAIITVDASEGTVWLSALDGYGVGGMSNSFMLTKHP